MIVEIRNYNNGQGSWVQLVRERANPTSRSSVWTLVRTNSAGSAVIASGHGTGENAMAKAHNITITHGYRQIISFADLILY